MKFRSIEKTAVLQTEYFEENHSSPSHVTMRNWVQKVGYYELTRTKAKGNWIIITDHSIQFGQEKILVVLGIEEKDFLLLNRPVTYEDLTPLLIKPAAKWNGVLVSTEIDKLKLEIGNIIYATADYGSDLRKGLRLSNVIHIHDLSHMIALILEKLYSNDQRYQLLKSQMSRMRSKFIQTNIAEIVPPAGRNKSEYQNFERIINWANRALNLIDNKLKIPIEIKKLEHYFDTQSLERMEKELDWLHEHTAFIEELTEINQVVKKIEKEFKHNGLNNKTLEICKAELGKLTNPNGCTFRETFLAQIEAQKKLLPDTKKILFSSDILESTFGRYKNRLSENPMSSVSGLMLIIAAYTAKITPEYTKEVMEKVKTSNVKAWEEKQIGYTLFKKRNILFSKE